MTQPTAPEVRVGQIYARVNRVELITYQLRVEAYTPGADTATVANAYTGKRRREIAVAKLRPAGPPSSTVWRLVSDVPVVAGPCSPPKHSTATVSPCECEDQR